MPLINRRTPAIKVFMWATNPGRGVESVFLYLWLMEAAVVETRRDQDKPADSKALTTCQFTFFPASDTNFVRSRGEVEAVGAERRNSKRVGSDFVN
jgi:hypothetical protein